MNQTNRLVAFLVQEHAQLDAEENRSVLIHVGTLPGGDALRFYVDHDVAYSYECECCTEVCLGNEMTCAQLDLLVETITNTLDSQKRDLNA